MPGVTPAQQSPQPAGAATSTASGTNGTGRPPRIYLTLGNKNRQAAKSNRNVGTSTSLDKLGGADTYPTRNDAAESGAGTPDPLYYGGPVISNVQVVVVYWGDNVDPGTTTGIPSFYSAITNSTWIDLLSEYSTNGVNPTGGGTPGNESIGRGQLNGVYTITPSAANAGATVDDTQIQAELLAQIAAGHLPAPITDSNGWDTSLYMIYFPPGITVTLDGESSCNEFCAYHGTVTLSQNKLPVPYGVLPDLGPTTACYTECAPGTEFEDLTTVSSHELAESITDTAVGLATTYAPPLAWYDESYGEIGDICVASGNASFESVLPASGYTVQKIWSNVQQDCVAAPPTFALSAPASVFSGALLNLSLTVQSSTGATLSPPYTGTVAFTSSDGSASLPADYTFTVADNNTHTFSNAVAMKSLGSQTITATDTHSGGFTGTVHVSVSTSVYGYYTLAGPSSAGSGTPFTFTVTALTGSGSPNPAYTGTVHFTSSDPLATLPPNTTITGGAGTFSATLRTAGAQAILANDTVNNAIDGWSNSISVSAGLATHLAVSAPASIIDGTAFPFTVTALDAAGNISTGYTDTVHFTSSDTLATLPANSKLTNGVGKFNATLMTGGPQAITATDTVASTIGGASGSITVGGPDLILSSFSVLTTAPVSGGSFSVSDTTTNQGIVPAGGSLTAFYLSTDGKTLGTVLATRAVNSLAAGASSGPVTTTFTLPTSLSGSYYVIACVNYGNATPEINYSNNCAAAVPIQMAGADLIVSSFSVLTTAPASGGSFSVSDTTTNQGLGTAGSSMTGFYLSTNGTTLGTLLKTRVVNTLAAKASNGPVTTTITLPTSLGGTYYVIACADYTDTVAETSYSNNCKASAAMQVSGTDLIVSSFSVLTTAPASGGSLSVSDTTTNQGIGASGTSITGFYLSSDGKTLSTLLKTRTVNALATGASNGPVTTTITLPTNLSGTYYMIACANYSNAVVETNYSNNCTAAAMQVAGADLIESSFSVLTTAPVSGGILSVSDTATNQGFGIAGTSITGFYLSSDGKTLSTLLKTRTVNTLAAGASNGPVTTTITLPTNLSGTYYMIACANYNYAYGVVETNYSNNCTAAAMQVAGADLIESNFSVLTTTPVSGGILSVSDTATNQGLGIAGTSIAGFYLSTDGKTLGTLLKTRTVNTLAAGASNGPVTTTITLPAMHGTYYMIACANYNYAYGVVETNYANNCTASAPMLVP